MTISNDCLQAIKKFEGFKSKAYKCPAGVWTIGYGHTSGVKPGMVISDVTATLTLKQDLAKRESFLNNLGFKLTQGQFDALIDFIFNVGTGNFIESSMYQLLKAKAKPLAVAEQFKRWVYANGNIQQGLVERRDWEYNKYLQK